MSGVEMRVRERMRCGVEMRVRVKARVRVRVVLSTYVRSSKYSVLRVDLQLCISHFAFFMGWFFFL